jgi:energy-coupling factor transport system permease protein
VRPAIAQYYPGDSIVHRLDARAKFVAVGALAVALFVRDSFAGLGVFAAAGVVAFALSGVPAAWFWRAFRPLLWLIGLTFLTQLLFAPGEPFFSWWVLDFSWEGLQFAALRRLRVPTDELALMVTIALRFIPTLLVELEQIMRAQRSRGADFGSGGPIRRAKALVPVLTPLFVVSFRRADELALAMEARCYRPGILRTRLHPLSAGVADAVLLAATAAVIVAGLRV